MVPGFTTVPIEAWRVSVRSAETRRTTIAAHDGWRDPFHMPLEESRLDPGETVSVAVSGDGARGPLTVRIHLVVRGDDLAHGDLVGLVGVAALVDDRQRRTEPVGVHVGQADASGVRSATSATRPVANGVTVADETAADAMPDNPDAELPDKVSAEISDDATVVSEQYAATPEGELKELLKEQKWKFL